jgi:hypothetical protein
MLDGASSEFCEEPLEELEEALLVLEILVNWIHR